MKVLIDILTPKQCMLFSRLSKRLEDDGCQILRTTRDYHEVVQLLQLKEIETKVIGRHGGGTLAGKLSASGKRILELASLVQEWRPDIVVSFSSPEATRVAFGLGIPHVCVNDSPHAEAVARLTIPLSKRLLTPKIIPKKEWVKFGISRKRIIQYNALDAWAWLKDFKPDENVLRQLGLDRSRPIVTFRAEEAFAAYLLGKTPKRPLFIPLIKELTKASQSIQMVVLPRYKEQASSLIETLGERIVICDSVVDAPSLLYYSSIFVGAGGTMSIEATLLGIPTFSCYPDKPFLIEKYLIDEGLIVRENNHDKLTKKIMITIDNLESIRLKQKEKSKRLTANFEDPVDAIASVIEDNVHKV